MFLHLLVRVLRDVADLGYQVDWSPLRQESLERRDVAILCRQVKAAGRSIRHVHNQANLAKQAAVIQVSNSASINDNKAG